MRPKAVHFGAGNIGRGFLGQLYFESGYHTIFVDVVPELVQALNERGEYPIHIAEERSETIQVKEVSAIHGEDIETVADALAQAVIASTAVGVNSLSKVAPALAAGIEKRFQKADAPPLNIIVCENMIGAEEYLRDETRAYLPLALHPILEERVGFVEASIGRMAPLTQHHDASDDILAVSVEPYCELPVDKAGFRGPIPEVAHMQPRDNFSGYVERKLYVHNAGHAATAYLGHVKGYDFIWEAISDSAIRTEVEGALAESKAALVARHGLDPEELQAHIDDLIRRFQNKALGDQVVRVAKDPLRKLGPQDRLIGAANLCIEYGIAPVHLAFAVAAAIEYDQPGDPTAQELQRLRQQHGFSFILTQVCQVPEDSPLEDYITEGSNRLTREGWIQY